jgi:hypothetical protein
MWLKWILLLLVSSQAWGYKLTADFTNGFYWATLPISISVVESDPNRKALLESLSQKAMKQWENDTNLSLWSYNPAGSATNIIRWSTNFAAETHMDPNTVLAVTIRYTNGPYFARTEIVINGGSPYNNTFDHGDLYTTLSHELGHTMGLDHSSLSSAIMAPTLQGPNYQPQSDDIQGMSEAYSVSSQRQATGYISPLSYDTKSSSTNGLSCGTVGASATGAGWTMNGLFSLATGLLISFIRRIRKWFKQISF